MIRQLDEQEILRYLGYPAGNAPDPEVAALIRQCSTRLLETARPKYIENIFPLNHTEGAVMLSGSDIRLTGNAITNHLQNCTQCVIMAATLGIEADRLSARHSFLSTEALSWTPVPPLLLRRCVTRQRRKSIKNMVPVISGSARAMVIYPSPCKRTYWQFYRLKRRLVCT